MGTQRAALRGAGGNECLGGDRPAGFGKLRPEVAPPGQPASVLPGRVEEVLVATLEAQARAALAATFIFLCSLGWPYFSCFGMGKKGSGKPGEHGRGALPP